MKNKLINLAKKENIELEIYETKTKRTDINLMNEEESLFQVVNNSNYVIKAIMNGKCLKMATSSIKDANKVIENIKTIMAIQDNDNKNYLSKGKINNKVKYREVLDYNKVKEDLYKLNNLKVKYPEVSNLEITYSHYDKGFYIDNIDCKKIDEGYFNEYGIGITVSKNNVNKVSYVTYYSKNYDIDGFYELVESKIQALLAKLDGNSCITNKYKVILENNVVAAILDTFVSMFDTQEIVLKESVLADKYKEKVFSDKISIAEDPMGELAVLKRAFDSEGTKTSYKVIVDKGVFVKRINNLEYALKENEEPTGNAYGVNNLYIVSGNKSHDELISMLDNGIIIDNVMGLHSGIDVKSGNISVQAEGLLVENGKVTKGLSMIILSTNIFEILSNVLEVGDDLSKESCGVTAPSILLHDITIAGKE